MGAVGARLHWGMRLPHTQAPEGKTDEEVQGGFYSLPCVLV